MKFKNDLKTFLVAVAVVILSIETNAQNKNLTNNKIFRKMNTEKTLRSQIIGAWKLKKYVEIDVETGNENFPFGENPDGFIIYTSDGYMSAQIEKLGRKEFKDNDMFKGTPDEYIESGSGYLAYSGRFFLDEEDKIITHEMAVSLFPNWLGKKQKRIIKIEGNFLNLQTERPMIFNGKMKTAKITWEKAESNN